MLGLERSLGTRLVTYADDLVILCRRGNAEAALHHLREIMGKLKLTVNEDKTRICKGHERDHAFRDRPFDHFGNSAPAAENRSLKIPTAPHMRGSAEAADLPFTRVHQRVVAIRGGPSISARARSLAPETRKSLWIDPGRYRPALPRRRP